MNIAFHIGWSLLHHWSSGALKSPSGLERRRKAESSISPFTLMKGARGIVGSIAINAKAHANTSRRREKLKRQDLLKQEPSGTQRAASWMVTNPHPLPASYSAACTRVYRYSWLVKLAWLATPVRHLSAQRFDDSKGFCQLAQLDPMNLHCVRLCDCSRASWRLCI